MLGKLITLCCHLIVRLVVPTDGTRRPGRYLNRSAMRLTMKEAVAASAMAENAARVRGGLRTIQMSEATQIGVAGLNRVLCTRAGL